MREPVSTEIYAAQPALLQQADPLFRNNYVAFSVQSFGRYNAFGRLSTISGSLRRDIPSQTGLCHPPFDAVAPLPRMYRRDVAFKEIEMRVSRRTTHCVRPRLRGLR